MASETFRTNCYDDTKRQRIVFVSDALVLSNEDIDVSSGVKFDLASCTAQQIQFGCTPCNSISLSILNEDGRISADSISGREFKCAIGVEVDTSNYLAPSHAITAINTGLNMISVHTVAPYVRGNVAFESLLPQLMNGWNCKIMLAYDVLYFVVKHNTDMYYAKHTRTGNNSFGEYEAPSDTECAMLERLMNVSSYDAVAYYDGGMTEYTFDRVVNPVDTWSDMNDTIWDSVKATTWGSHSGYTIFSCVGYESVPYGVWHFDRPRRINSAVITLNGKDRMAYFDEDSADFISTMRGSNSYTLLELVINIAEYKGVPVVNLDRMNELFRVEWGFFEYNTNKSLKDLLSYAFEVGGCNVMIDREGRLSPCNTENNPVDIPYVYSFDVADYITHTIGKVIAEKNGANYKYQTDDTVLDGETYDWSDNPYFFYEVTADWFSNHNNWKYGNFRNAITVTDADYSLWADDVYQVTVQDDKEHIESCTFDVNFTQEGSGDPTIDNPRAIVGTSEVSLISYGKNLYNPGTSDSKLGVTYTVNTDGSVSLGGVATSNADFICFENITLPAGTYTLGKSGNSNIRIFVREINSSGTILMQATTTNKTETLDGTTTYAGVIRIIRGTDVNGVTLYPILVKGDSIGTFEKFTSSTDTWELGQTIYKATIDASKNECPIEYKELLLTEDNYDEHGFNYNFTYDDYVIIGTSLFGAKSDGEFTCNIAKQVENISDVGEANLYTFDGDDVYVYISIPTGYITMDGDWEEETKAFLRDHPIQIVYEVEDGVKASIEPAPLPKNAVNVFADGVYCNTVRGYNTVYREPIFTMSVEWNGSGRVTYSNYGEETRTYASYTNRIEGTTNINDQNLQGLNQAQSNDKVSFDSDGMTVQNDGIRVLNRSGEEVLATDADGNLKAKGNIQADSGYVGTFNIIEDGIKCGGEDNFIYFGYDSGSLTMQGENLSLQNVGTTATSANAVLVTTEGNWRKFYVSTSLKKMKDNIKTIANASEKVDNLRGVSFTSKCEADDPKVTLYGFIAEEVQDAVPELASYNNGKLQGVQYDRVCALLVEDNKACHRRIEALEKKIEELERRLDK